MRNLENVDMTEVAQTDGYQCRIIIETETHRVSEHRVPPGSSTGLHTHEFAYSVVPIHGGTLEIEAGDGARSTIEMATGRSYDRPAGTTHSLSNHGSAEVLFIEVERS